MSRATPKTGPMCVVRINLMTDLLLPTSEGLKLVALLTKAVLVDSRYQERVSGTGYGNVITVMGAPEVEFNLVTEKDTIAPAVPDVPGRKSKPAGPLLLEHEQ